jgi:2-polyprenyl-3-methyl-5-hydroxy-6-metoxy-1,4-benzoquinol methylase
MNIEKVCAVCGNAGQHRTFAVREMMFGLREEFEYFECGSCGSLQIYRAPADPAKYYPGGYFSFIARPDVVVSGRDSTIAQYLRSRRSEYILRGKGLVGRIANIVRPLGYSSAQSLSWLKRCRATLASSVLDVGCGCGNMLLNLERLGFRNLFGLDPFIERDIERNNNVKILKGTMRDIDMKFDIIMLHHSLEHMSDPSAAFQDAARLLKSSGHMVIRTPVVPSYAWEHYGSSWVQIDAPRHLFIFSLKGIGILAKKEALKIKDVVFDSTEFQFIGSEQYLKDVPLTAERSYFINRDKSIFTESDIGLFRKKADELNRQNMGDQAAIYFTKFN